VSAGARREKPAADPGQRFEGLTARLGGGAGPKAGGTAPTGPKTDYWQSVHDLFTRDVTGRGLGDLMGREAPDALRFFVRDVDFAALKSRPWYQRYPAWALQVLQAVAYRLSPARRLLFAGAVVVLVVGWIQQLVGWAAGRWVRAGVYYWVLLAGTLLLLLLVVELRDKLALKGDLEVARQIQFGLLPFEPYERAGTSVLAHMRPANTVGGDYFDVIELPEGRLALVMGDVAGKGMPAALLMALLQGSLRTLLTAGHRGSELLATLNAHLVSNIPSNRLVTLFYAELDPADGGLRYVNAGHNAPYLVHAGGAVERLAATAMALGIVGDSPFEAGETRLHPGGQLFLFTDGVTEAFNPQDVEYGEERLEAVLRSSAGAPGRALIDAVVADVTAFCRGAAPRDDMTLMLVRRQA
jgi:serine phosphatase RsbU (regulator of sigma subunit)